MFDQAIDPIDWCGCGDTGYLTTRSIPIDLAHGVGRIDKVPVYHCRSSACQEFTLPQAVSRRLDDIAEEMEKTHSLEEVYTWEFQQRKSLDPHQRTNDPLHLQAFTLQFADRNYDDAHVALIIPGQAIFFQSTLDDTEFYLLRYEAEPQRDGIWFSFCKFYYEESELTYEKFLEWSEDGLLKELGRIPLDEVEDTLSDEFGDWT